MSSAAGNAAAEAQQTLRDTINAGVDVVLQAVGSRQEEAESALAKANEVLKVAQEEATKIKGDAEAAAEDVQRKAREALDEENAAMERVHTFQRNKVIINVGGYRNETSLQTGPDTSLFFSLTSASQSV